MSMRCLGLFPLVLTATAAASGGSVAGRAVVRLEVPYTLVRPGEAVPVRGFLDIEGACEYIEERDGLEFLQLTSDADACAGPTTCAEALDPAFTGDPIIVTLRDIEVGGELVVALSPCWIEDVPGTALCGEVVIPPFTEGRHFTRVVVDGAGAWSKLINDAPEPAFAGLTVAGEGGDVMPPHGTGITVPKDAVSVRHPGIVFTVEDDLSGLSSVVIHLRRKSSDGSLADTEALAYALCGPAEPPDTSGARRQTCVADQALLGPRWRNPTGDELQSGVLGGEWRVGWVTGEDRAGHSLYWAPPDSPAAANILRVATEAPNSDDLSPAPDEQAGALDGVGEPPPGEPGDAAGGGAEPVDSLDGAAAAGPQAAGCSARGGRSAAAGTAWAGALAGLLALGRRRG